VIVDATIAETIAAIAKAIGGMHAVTITPSVHNVCSFDFEPIATMRLCVWKSRAANQ